MPSDKQRRTSRERRTETIQSETYSRIYSNFASTSVSPIDVRLTFSEILLSDDEKQVIKEHVTITMTPEQAKALYELLGRNIKDYEEKIGPIRWPLSKQS